MVGEVEESLTSGLEKCGAGGENARIWKKLELGRSMWGNDPYAGGHSKYALILTDFVGKCEGLTDLVIEVLRSDWVSIGPALDE